MTDYDATSPDDFSAAVTRDAARQVRDQSLPGALDYWNSELERLRKEEQYALAQLATIHAAQSDPHPAESATAHSDTAAIAHERRLARRAREQIDSGAVDLHPSAAGRLEPGSHVSGRPTVKRAKQYKPRQPKPYRCAGCNKLDYRASANKTRCDECRKDHEAAAKRAARAC